jgi:hypothetical protein
VLVLSLPKAGGNRARNRLSFKELILENRVSGSSKESLSMLLLLSITMTSTGHKSIGLSTSTKNSSNQAAISFMT